MEKERKITAPEGCEIEKVELIDGVAVVTFREKKRKLPKSWEEFCEMFPDYTGEYFIEPNNIEKIDQVEVMGEGEKRTYKNAELLPDHATAEAILALCQLIQLRNAYNGDWVPDWTRGFYTGHRVSVIGIRGVCGVPGKIDINNTYSAETPFFLHFKDDKTAIEFLRNFRDLIEKLKPLYGIKEGGQND